MHDESQLFATYFWYDAVGRLVLSQNSKQGAKSPKAYSYTLYDALGRITEVGEKPENTTSGQARFSDVFGQTINGIRYSTINNDSLLSWINAGSRKEVTKTFYDTVAVSTPLSQDNLRKRVSAVTYEDVDDGNPLTYNHATFYSYDIHGNVKTLLQDNPSLASIKQRYKKVDYDYDLISGKVNNVYYQHDSLDAFSHHYEYDADNRITEVFTSAYPAVRWSNYQSTFWDRDARYTYYNHGPLARIEYGDNHVQGADYYYTIQGWIKGVNSNILSATNDGGQDGYNISTNANKNMARDVYGYTLGYFQNDYSPIDTSKWNTISKRFEANTSGSSLAAARYDLFNGNISQMVTTLIQPDTNWSNQTILPQGTAYKYDQLNRLVEMKAFINLTNNAFGTVAYDGRYNNRFSYDANGNILSQVRKNQAGQTFDSLTYKYNKDIQGRVNQNRLYHVNDTISSAVMTDDIDNQGVFDASRLNINTANNYSYDKTGDLVRDSSEGIAVIDWNVYGKIKSITHRTGFYRLNGTDTVRPPDIVFNYDAAGKRISKVAKPRTATTVLGDTAWTTTHYLRDAEGNVLSIYKQHDSAAISTAYFTQIERHLYGSSRLGIDNTSIELLGATFSTDTSNHYTGNKGYELTNHLGNVLATVADRRIPLDTNHNDTIDYYVAYVNSSSDYSPFGAPLDGRTFNNGSYKFGFGGQMHDNDIYGIGNAYTAEYWEYDSRLGRRWNVDPVDNSSEGSYTCFSNIPILFNDPAGKEPGDPLKANPKEDTKGAAGSTAPNNGIVQEGGGVQGGTAFCAYCGANGENTYGIPDDPNQPQINQPNPSLSSVTSFQTSGDISTTGGFSGEQATDYWIGIFRKHTPVITPALDSGDELVQGNYAASIGLFGLAAADLYTGGEASAEEQLAKEGVQAFDVGAANELKSASKVGDNLEIHHAGQAHAFEQIIPGYNRATGPAIVLPKGLHKLIPNQKGIIAILPRMQLAKDALNLRSIGVPNEKIMELIELNKNMYPEAFKK